VTTIEDVNRTGIHEIDLELRQRLVFGHPYMLNGKIIKSLEQKRRSAILYLRSTRRGWCLDKPK
jgi:hypothetical protein